MQEEVRKRSRIGKMIKICAIVISLFFYLFFLTRIFMSRDADIADDIYLDEHYHEEFMDKSSDFQLLLYEPLSWTNDEGTVQLKNIHYMPEAKRLEITVKYNMNYFGDTTDPLPFAFALRKVTGDKTITAEDPAVYFESRYSYGYIRICFDNIEIDDGEKEQRESQEYDEELGIDYTKVETVTVGGDKVYLDIYGGGGGEKQYSFIVAGKTVGARRIKRSSVDLVRLP